MKRRKRKCLEDVKVKITIGKKTKGRIIRPSEAYLENFLRKRIRSSAKKTMSKRRKFFLDMRKTNWEEIKASNRTEIKYSQR